MGEGFGEKDLPAAGAAPANHARYASMPVHSSPLSGSASHNDNFAADDSSTISGSTAAAAAAIVGAAAVAAVAVGASSSSSSSSSAADQKTMPVPPAPAMTSTPLSPSASRGTAVPWSPKNAAASAAALTFQPQILPLSIPEWTYLFKPFSGQEGAEVSVGRIATTVLSAENLPQMDFLFNTAAPYVTVRCGSKSKRTHTASPANAAAALSPDWSLPNTLTPLGLGSGDGNGTNYLVLDVPNVLETLHVELWEKMALGKDVLVGSVAVPLTQLAKPEFADASAAQTSNNPSLRHFKIDAWLPLKINPDVANAGAKMGNQMLQGLNRIFDPSEWAQLSEAKKKAKLQEAQRKQEMERKKALGGAGSARTRGGAPTTPLDPKLQPRLHVELAYSYSKIGEFCSHFTPPPVVALPVSKAKLEADEKRRIRREKKRQAGEDVASDDDEDSEDEGEDGGAPLLDDEAWETVVHPSSAEGAIEPFRLQACYELLRRSIVLAQPFFAWGAALSAAADPRASPLLWLLLTTTALTLALWPEWVTILLLGLVVRQMLWYYLYRVRAGGQPHVLDEEWRNFHTRALAAAAMVNGVTGSGVQHTARPTKNPSMFSAINPLNLVFSGSSSSKAAKESTAASATPNAPASGEDHPDIATLERLLMPLIRSSFMVVLGTPLEEGQAGLNALASMQSQYARFIAGAQSLIDAMEFSGSMLQSNCLFLALALAWAWDSYFSLAYPVAIGQTNQQRDATPTQPCVGVHVCL